ncbi:MAG: GNAT family N-acetyltransferase [Bacteroidia bacterium]|jgi:predicted acetyltransferase
MQDLALETATPNDAAILTECRIKFALELSGQQSLEAIQTLQEQMEKYFKQATEDGSCISIIARIGSEIAGIGSMHIRITPGNFKNPSGRWGYIMNMYTVPAFRRRGVCKTILNALVEAGANQGITAFELHATAEGERVYVKNGFELQSQPTFRKFISVS